jgi:ankyrin repeat protein
LDRGSKVKAKDKDGKTALMLAVAESGYEQIKIVKLLLNQGADVRDKDNNGSTALSLAQKSYRPDTSGNRPAVLELLKNAMGASH